ncbi:MAG: hypothetical protein ACF8MJ_06285 [Phycisphaerales bacterium JB050]
MKCTCKALVAFAGGVAMISSAAVASPSTSDKAPDLSTANGQKPASQTISKEMVKPVFTLSEGNGLRGTNDVCAGAESIDCGASVEADLTLASPGVDEPFSCAIGTENTNTLWYSFVATDNAATISTCNTGVATDSTVNVFSGSCGALVEIGCSEDTCGASGFLSSATVSGLTVGETYYVQVGAWTADTVGTYTVEVDCFFQEACDECADGSTPEGEAILVDGDDDITNGGCNSDPNVFGSISVGETVCGTASLYLDSTSAAVRDTDWYEFTLTETTSVEWAVTGELAIQALLVDAGDCSGAVVIGTGGGVSAGPCAEIVVSADLAPGTYVAFAAFPAGSGLPNGTSMTYNAELRIGGLTQGACCDFDGNCVETIQSECDGFFTAEATCAEVECLSVDCPGDANIEGFGFGEELFNGYNDSLNSGCNADSGIAIADFPVCGDVWCGTSGTHLDGAGGQVRDTDWYQLDVFESTDINWRVTATFDVLSFIIEAGAPGDECTFGALQQAATGLAGETVDNIATLAPGTYYLFVSTQTFEGVPANAPYVAELLCVEPEPQACCFGDGSCQMLLAPDCSAEGGIPQGEGVTCADSPCCVVCDGSEAAEGEVTCFEEYDDLFNSGCNASDASFPLSSLDVNVATCGTTGTFTVAGLGNRDTDWYSFDHPGGPITMTVAAGGYDALAGILNVLPDGSNCDTAAFLDGFVGFTEGCTPVVFTGELAAGTYVAFVSTADFTGVPCGFEYNILIETGDSCDPLCADVTGDGNVDLADLNAVLGNFGQATSDGDANCDGNVDLADLNLVLAQFGGAC